MLSTAPYMNWIFLESSLKYLDTIGFDVVRARLMELADSLAEILRKHNFTVLRDKFSVDKTAIVSAHRTGDMAALHAALMKAGVVCALREGNLRFSPHLNTDAADFARFDKILADLK